MDDEGNFVFDEKIAKMVKNQLNFETVHEPGDNEAIAKFLRCDNPFKKGGARKYAKSRGRDSSGDDDGDDDTDEKPKKRKARKKSKGKRSPAKRR